MTDQLEYRGHGEPDPHESAFNAVMLFSGKLREALEAITDDLRFCSESELCEKADPTITDWALRQRFHDEVSKARQTESPAVPTARIYEDIVSRAYFTSYFINNLSKVAFMFRPVIDHRERYKALFNLGMERLGKWAKTADLDDPKQLAQFTKFVQISADRAHGPVAQAMQITSRNLNVEVNATREAAQIPDSPEQLQAKIEEMRLKLTGGFRDVETTEG